MNREYYKNRKQKNSNNSLTINNYFKCKWTKCSNQKTQGGWMDTTRPVYYAAYKGPTSDQKTHTDWK